VGEPPHDEVVSRPDSNDTRMQQVTFANGKLWGALDTSINPDGGPQRAGIEYFVFNPSAGTMVLEGYLGATGYDFTYPAIGVTPSGRGVMAFTATGNSLFPSAAYAGIDAQVGVTAWDTVTGGEGAAPTDGFTSYSLHPSCRPDRERPGRRRTGRIERPPAADHSLAHARLRPGGEVLAEAWARADPSDSRIVEEGSPPQRVKGSTPRPAGVALRV
jgi:hypothetical protein